MPALSAQPDLPPEPALSSLLAGATAVAGVTARSPWPAGPPHPPEATVTAVPPVSPELAEALLVGAAAVTPAMTPPEAEDPQQEDVILPS